MEYTAVRCKTVCVLVNRGYSIMMKLMELDAQKRALDDELMLLYEKWEELNQ